MHSNAQIEYKQKAIIYLNEFITNYKKQMLKAVQRLTIDEIKAQLAGKKKLN